MCSDELLCVCVAAQMGQLEPLLNVFTAEEERQMKRMLQRVDILANVSIATRQAASSAGALAR